MGDPVQARRRASRPNALAPAAGDRHIPSPKENGADACSPAYRPAPTWPARSDAVLTAVLRTALLALALTLVAAPAWAFGQASAFTFAIARHGGHYDPRPSGLKRIAWEIAKRTSIEVALEPKVLDLTDPALFEHPFLVLTGDGEVPAFSDAEREALRRYLTFGGFLLVDDASGQPDGAFDRSVRRELRQVLPAAPIGRVPSDHVLFKSFYLLEGPFGRVANGTAVDGVALQGRLAVVFSPNDMQGAAARDSFGNWEYEVVPGGERQREFAVRFGINVVMYALCLDYKDDQVHVPFIMKRRR